jgi:radical SAM protein with 4Fe4S-binding SPASM domain
MLLQNPEIRLEPTNRCNAHCVMCPREKMTRKQGIMSTKLFEKIIEQAIPMGAKICSIENFGEPFLDPEILSKATYARNKGLAVYTISNGQLITPEITDKAVRVFDRIRISLYGVSAATYENVHRGLDYMTSYNNLEYLLAHKGSCTIEVYFLSFQENDHETEGFIRRYNGKAKIAVWKPHNWIDGRNYRELTGPRKTCGRPFKGPLQVQWDGKVVPCCWDYNSTMVLGDLNIQSIEEILSGKLYAKIRKAHETKNFDRYPCGKCDQLLKYNDVLIYTNISEAGIGKTNTGYDRLDT